MSKKRDYHVVPNPGGGWTVRREGTIRPDGKFVRKDDAVQHAKVLARSSHSGLITHGRDGRIREQNNYGMSPYSMPKGYGSLSGRISLREDVDISKPIFEQTRKSAKKGKRSRSK